MTRISCVMTTIVTPSVWLISLSRRRIDCVVFGSRALVASSHRRYFGRVARARAMATRCFWPPESCEGYAFARSDSPTSSSSSAARACASSRLTPAISSGKQMLRSTVRCSSRLKLWKIMPMSCRALSRSRRLSCVMSRPSMRTVPEVGRSRRLMQRTSVLLPAPLRPMMPKISPSSMRRSTSRSAWMSPVGEG